MEFFRQEDWSRLPSTSPGNHSDPGIEPVSPALAGELFTTEPPGKVPQFSHSQVIQHGSWERERHQEKQWSSPNHRNL